MRPETEQPAYPLPSTFAQQPMAAQQMQQPVAHMQQPGAFPAQNPQAPLRHTAQNMPETMGSADLDTGTVQQTAAMPNVQQMGYQPKGILPNICRSRDIPSRIRSSILRGTSSRISRYRRGN